MMMRRLKYSPTHYCVIGLWKVIFFTLRVTSNSVLNYLTLRHTLPIMYPCSTKRAPGSTQETLLQYFWRKCYRILRRFMYLLLTMINGNFWTINIMIIVIASSTKGDSESDFILVSSMLFVGLSVQSNAQINE